MARPDRRSPEADAYRRLYGSPRWKNPKYGVRAKQLADHPLCAMCLKAERLTPATVCDHLDPRTKDDPETFFEGPFQSLCGPHHNSTKQRSERLGFEVGCDAAGRPTDPNHLWNRKKLK